jgi:hypothetical protein
MDAQVYVINVGQVSSDSREICLQVCSYDWSRMRGMSVCSETTSVSSESRSWGSQLLTMRNIKPTNMRRLATSATCKLTPYQSRFMDQPCQTQWATTSDSCVTSVFVHTLTMRAPKKWTGAGPIPKSLSSVTRVSAQNEFQHGERTFEKRRYPVCDSPGVDELARMAADEKRPAGYRAAGW